MKPGVRSKRLRSGNEGAASTALIAATWLAPGARASRSRPRAWPRSAERRARSATRCRRGGWTGTARSRPDAPRDAPQARRTASHASDERRPYHQILRHDWGFRGYLIELEGASFPSSRVKSSRKARSRSRSSLLPAPWPRRDPHFVRSVAVTLPMALWPRLLVQSRTTRHPKPIRRQSPPAPSSRCPPPRPLPSMS